ncbi:MAG: ABC transporter ATP-binding protein [Clostridia bacterium]|nr:ABC transporter ATP-binding protein [Clostridia bacterium]
MIKIFKNFTKKQFGFIAGALVFIVLQVFLDLKLPDYMAEITRLVETPGSKMADILSRGGMMLLCAFASMLCSVAVVYFGAKVSGGLSMTLRGKVYDKVMSFSVAENRRFSTASLINRTTTDINQIQNLVAMGLQAIIKAPILAIWAIIKISGKSFQWMSATAAALALLIIMLATTLLVAHPRFKKIQTLTDNLSRVTREQLTGIRIVRAYNADKYQEEKFDEANRSLAENNLVAHRVMAIMQPGMTFISSALTLSVYWIGAYMINDAARFDRLGIFSDMVVFSNYAIQVIMAFMMLNMIFILLPRAQVSAKRINEVFETEPAVHDGTIDGSVAEVSGEIEFRGVSFRYPNAHSNALSDITFSARRGQTVAFIGATGSGKTTLVNLVERFYDATEGEILIDGINIKDMTLHSLHNKIGFVAQKANLFSGTVASNIGYGENSKSDDDLRFAAEIAQSTDFIEALPDKFDSHIAQGGTNVSGGQRQRLTIARAIAHKPEILIFDDSFSALDYSTDRALRAALNEKTDGVTKLIVAQRIGTIRSADKIIVLDKGRIVGEGTHGQLIKNCPVYLEIAQSQLSKEEIENG